MTAHRTPPAGREPAGDGGARLSRGHQWAWALVFVGSLHLLTTSGAWANLDHGEILYTARHVLHHGTFDLTAPGVPRLKFMPSVRARPGHPVRSRFLPIPTLSLVPLVYADERLGWVDEREFGHLVHLQGHLFVMAGLALLGLAIRRSGGSNAAAAMAVLLAGLAWPVWLVSRRVGPEPVMIFLLCAFLLAESIRDWKVRAGFRGLVCLLLPWVHVTGAPMSAALVLGSAAHVLTSKEKERRVRCWADVATLATMAVVGAASMIYFWNYRFHGNWVAGGYALYQPEEAFGARNALRGATEHLSSMVLEMPVTLGLALAGIRAAAGGRALDGVQSVYWTLAISLTAVLFILFCTFFSPEPTRRLAVVWPIWAAVVGTTWDRLRLPPPWPQALVAVAGLVSFAWFAHVDGGWRIGPRGVNLPQYVLWADLVRAGRPWWVALGPVALLVLVAIGAAAKVWALLHAEGPVSRLDRSAAAL